MKFNKEAYKGKGRKPTGSDPKPKRIKIVSPGPTKEGTSVGSGEVTPLSLPSIETAPLQASVEVELPPPSSEVPQTAGAAPGPSAPANLVDDPSLAIKRMENIISPADLDRVRSITSTRLAKNIAHDLAKVMLWSAELGTRFVGANKDFLAENKKNERLAAQVALSEADLEKARSEAQLAKTERDEALQSSANLSSALAAEIKLKEISLRKAEELERQLGELRAQVEEQKLKAIEDFKESGEAQDWLAEAFQDGFEDAKAEVLKLHPDLDLSTVVFGGEAAPESPSTANPEAAPAEEEGGIDARAEA